MSKRARANELEDWGRICNEIHDILLDQSRDIFERIKIAKKAKARMAYYWIKSCEDFEIIWRLRWERFQRALEGLEFAVQLDCSQCLI